MQRIKMRSSFNDKFERPDSAACWFLRRDFGREAFPSPLSLFSVFEGTVKRKGRERVKEIKVTGIKAEESVTLGHDLVFGTASPVEHLLQTEKFP